jgi:phosphopantothenoylcysteine decarboxylase/phosphopantothenate--cysteine ligase
MTPSAKQFVTPLTFQALSGYAVHTDLLNADEENAMGHISLARWADILLVAPATANSIAKFSTGLADDLLSTIYLAADCPVMIAPAMNQVMWLKPSVQANIKRVKQHGVEILGPDQGEQACGEFGPGRMLEPEAIAKLIAGVNKYSGVLQGKALLVSAGPTREPLDPVRYISNRSSGKMGYAIAEAARMMGAKVTLVSGPVSLTTANNITVISVETAEQMYDAVLTHAQQHDIYIGAAAVADYRPVDIKPQKIKKMAEECNIFFQKTQDILSAVAALNDGPFTVGFAAETHDLDCNAIEKLRRKNLDMIAANWVGKSEGGFDSECNALHVFWNGGQKEIGMAAKAKVAEQLLELINMRIDEKRTA